MHSLSTAVDNFTRVCNCSCGPGCAKKLSIRLATCRNAARKLLQSIRLEALGQLSQQNSLRHTPPCELCACGGDGLKEIDSFHEWFKRIADGLVEARDLSQEFLFLSSAVLKTLTSSVILAMSGCWLWEPIIQVGRRDAKRRYLRVRIQFEPRQFLFLRAMVDNHCLL